MGFSIKDLAHPDRVLFVNFWNWRPTVQIIQSAGILDASRLETLQEQCCATRVNADEARRIARHLRDIVLPSLPSESRVMLDGTSSTKPDDGTFHRCPAEFHLNYGASRSWIETFATFCESCGGFELN